METIPYNVCVVFKCLSFLFQFCVFKDLQGKEDEVSYEVGLKNWLVGQLDDEMNGVIRWPPDSANVGNLVRTEHPPDPNWDTHPVCVKRFYGTFRIILLRPEASEKYWKIDQCNIIKHETLGPKLFKTKIIRYENVGLK